MCSHFLSFKTRNASKGIIRSKHALWQYFSNHKINVSRSLSSKGKILFKQYLMSVWKLLQKHYIISSKLTARIKFKFFFFFFFLWSCFKAVYSTEKNNRNTHEETVKVRHIIDPVVLNKLNTTNYVYPIHLTRITYYLNLNNWAIKGVAQGATKQWNLDVHGI